MDRHELFEPLWTDSESNYFVITGGRGSSKSFSVSEFLENLSYEPNHVILYSRYTMVSAHLSIIPEFTEKIDRFGHKKNFKINKTEIENKLTGSKIVFRGIRTSSGNQTANLKSITGLTTFILDEAEELIDEDNFDTIDESIRLAGVQNRAIIIMNPATNEHWVYKRFFEEAGVQPGFNGVRKNVRYIHSSYIDNIKNLSSKFLRRAEEVKKANLSRYEHRYLGKWIAQAEGVIFTNWEFGAFDETLPYVNGMDFGFSDPDTLIRIAVDKKHKQIYLDELFYKDGQSVAELKTNTMHSLKKKDDLIIADCASPRMIHEIKADGINIVPVNKSLATIAETIKMMQDYLIIVTPKSKNIARELNNYCWNDKKAGVPIDDYNHTIDPSRYGFVFLTKPTGSGKILQTTRL